MVVYNNILAGASGQTSGAAAAFQINRSIRINDDDTAYFNRTPSSAGNQKTWTWSAWVKRSKLSAEANLFSVGASSTDAAFRFNSDDTLQVRDGNGGELTTNAVFRDPSAWYHIVVSLDTTQSTAADRFKVYINGTEQTYSASSYASFGANGDFNAAVAHYIGRQVHNTSNLFDGYLAEIHFVDGTQLAASDFGEYDDNNVWQPKEFTGSHNAGGGTIYSSQTITNENSSYTTDKMFDGVYGSSAPLDNSVIANETDGTYSVYTFANPISYSSSVRIFGDLDTRSTDPDIKANNTSVTGFTDNIGTGGANKKWYTVLSGSGTLSTVSLNQHSGYVAAIFAIEVDGTVLVDGGVNGFYLDFSDNTSTTTIAEDSSGNDNDWTANNLSVTAGAGNDSLLDTPTNYEADSGENGGNYCTWNPLDMETSVITLSEGNLKTVTTSSTGDNVRGTLGFSSGKWYWECTVTDFSGGFDIGFATPDWDLTAGDVGSVANSWSVSDSGTSKAEGTNTSGATSAFNSTGKVIGIAFDADAGSVKYFIDGTDQGVIFSGLDTSYTYMPAIYLRVATTGGIWNFGQRGSFTYDPPSGYKGLCTTNLPDPTIADGSTAMNIKTWSGDSTERAITGYGFSPDFVWIKTRSTSDEHVLSDIVRGAGKVLSSSANNKESDFSDPGHWGHVKSFDSDGFTLDDGAGGYHRVNLSGRTYVGWAWDAGTSTASNTDGSLTANVRANTSAGFSIIQFLGNATSGATVGHGLSAAPELVIGKNRGGSDAWWVWFEAHSSNASKFTKLNTNDAGTSTQYIANNTAPSSTVITLGSDYGWNSSQSPGSILYAFTPVSGFSAMGSYEGNGASGYPNADGPFVFTGMRPAFVMIKCVDATENWVIYDTARNTFNVLDDQLYPNATTAEASGANREIDVYSNGFKIRSNGGFVNSNGDTYLYAAFAEHPFKTARAR